MIVFVGQGRHCAISPIVILRRYIKSCPHVNYEDNLGKLDRRGLFTEILFKISG